MPLSKKGICYILLFLLILAGSTFTLPKQAHAQGVPLLERCYSVADGGDDLLYIKRTPPFTNTGNFVGNTGVSDIETIAFNIGATVLYAANDGTPDTFGTIDYNGTGAYSVIGSLSTGSNPAFGVAQTIDDIDSLSVHPWTGDIWAITQGPNYIFRISPTTGDIIPNTFGVGYDFAIVDLSTITGGPADVDDLAIDPTDGSFYIIANDSPTPPDDRLVRVNIDGADPPNSPGLNNPAVGSISTTDIGFITVGGVNITDMEGFSFFNDGNFYGATGNASGVPTHENRMWQINPANGQSIEIGPIDDPFDAITNRDFESTACLSAPPNTITGAVFLDSNASGTFDTGEVGQAGATVRLCRDTNGDGNCDPGEPVVQSIATLPDGSYSFEVGSLGNFALFVEPATLPAGADQSTPNDNEEAAVFPNTNDFNADFGVTDSRNNFGFVLPGSPLPPPPGGGGSGGGTGSAAPAPPNPQPDDPAAADPIIDVGVNPPAGNNGDPAQLTIMVTNPNDFPIDIGTVTDPIPPQFIIQGVSVTVGAQPVLNGQNFSWFIGTLQPGETVTAFIDVIVGGNACFADGPAVVTHEACVNPCDSASWICEPPELPTTGESPYSRLRLVMLVAVLTSLGLVALGSVRILRARSS